MNKPPMKPMLAKKLTDIKEEKLEFPYIAQRKYNGVRCTSNFDIYIVGDGLFSQPMPGVMLFSKQSNQYIVNHIITFLLSVYENPKYQSIIFDGELYIHGEGINVIKKRIPMVLPTGTITTPSLNPDPVKFIIYDIYDKDNPNMCQSDRLELLFSMYEDEDVWNNHDQVLLAETELVNNLEEVYLLRDKYIAEGYEGAMLRNRSGIYKSSRSRDLLKVKKILETECVILDIIDDGFKSGRENIGFILRNDRNDETFKATPGDIENSWDNAYKKLIYNDKHKYIGKLATVSFYERSGIKQVPFHANVKTIRDYE